MKKKLRSQAAFINKTIGGVFIGLIALALVAGGAYLNSIDSQTAQVDPEVQAILDEYNATMTAAAISGLEQ